MTSSSMNTPLLPSSLRFLITALLMACTAARAVDVKIVDDATVQKALQATVLVEAVTSSVGLDHANLGFFVSEDGLVVTVATGVEGAEKVSIRLADGSIVSDAKFMGMDENKHMAVLATNRKPPAFLELCDNAPLVGDACALMGLHQTYRSFQGASGQLLARHLSLDHGTMQNQFVDMWSIGTRHDCRFDGGAVVNSMGKVIGVGWPIGIREPSVMRARSDEDIRAALKKARQAGKPGPFPRLGDITPGIVSPAQSDTDFLAGAQSMLRGDYPTAIQRFKETLRRHPKDPRTLTCLTSCYVCLKNSQNEELWRWLDELAQTGVLPCLSRAAIAGILAREGNYTAANEQLKTLLKEEPRLGNAWNLHAEVLRTMGRKKEALEAARRAVELEPEFLKSWTTLSDILLELGEMKSYREAQDHANELETLIFKLDHLPLRGLEAN